MVERSKSTWHIDPQLKQSTMPRLDDATPQQKRQQLRDYFHNSYAIDTALYEPLRYEESFYVRADPLRHPLIFYYGHTAVFYINKLIAAQVTTQRINPNFESMFAIGVDEMSWDDLNQDHYDWPSLHQVEEYRQQVFQWVDQLIETLPLELPIHWHSPWWALLMAMEHQRIHLETSSVLIRQLSLEHVQPHPLWTVCRDDDPAPDNQLLAVDGGSVTLGKSMDHPLYGWDCEYGRRCETISDFKASRYLVSNAEYRPFVEAGGYQDRRWWDEEGWQWCQYQQATQPRFWRKDATGYRLRTMLAEQAMPWSWPVETNYLEAKAFCNWKSQQLQTPLRLPTEAEWLRLRDRQIAAKLPPQDTAAANINLQHFASSCPVDQFAHGEFYDVIGNVWQWTETVIDSLPGFTVHPCYDDFSTPTFDGRHNLIKGGSWISTGNEATREARYAFRRHFYQHAGFRYIASPQTVAPPRHSCESDPAIARLCADHYPHSGAQADAPQDNFMVQLAKLSLAHSGTKHRALQIGCEVGRCCLELAREFDAVTGIDLSANIIRRAVELTHSGYLGYELIEEGELTSHHQCTLEQLDLISAAARVTFLQADPCNLKPQFTGYDLIVISQVLERLYEPRKLLTSLAHRLNTDGVLVVATSYNWQPEITVKDHWLGSQRIDGEPISGHQALTCCLKQWFYQQTPPQLLHRTLHHHRYRQEIQHSEVTIWKKRPFISA